MSKQSKVIVEIVNGPAGPALYINDYRVCGQKPWGGGVTRNRFEIDTKELRTALSLNPRRDFENQSS